MVMDHAIRTLKTRIFRSLLTHYFLRLMVYGAFILGSLVLVLRFMGTPMQGLLWLAYLSIAGMAIAAFFQAGRQVPNSELLLAWLDKHNSRGGLLMATREIDIKAWEIETEDVPQPQIRLDLGSKLFQAGLAWTFALVCFNLPQRIITPPSPTPALNISSQTEGLNEKIEAMKEVDILPWEEAAQYQETLNSILENAGANNPSQTWEALDHLEKSLSRDAEEGAEAMANNLSDAKNLAEMASLMEKNARNLDENSLKTAMEELQNLLEKMAEENKALAEALAKQPQARVMTLGEMARALNMTSDQLRDRLEQMKEARLISQNQLEQLLKEGKQGSDKQLLAFLDDQVGEGAQCKALAKMAGNGGLSRGRADADMTWTDGTDENGSAFNTELLPSGSFSSPQDSTQIGLSASAPKVSETTSTFQNLNSDLQGNAGAHTHQLLPKHRSAVTRYFKPKKD